VTIGGSGPAGNAKISAKRRTRKKFSSRQRDEKDEKSNQWTDNCRTPNKDNYKELVLGKIRDNKVGEQVRRRQVMLWEGGVPESARIKA